MQSGNSVKQVVVIKTKNPIAFAMRFFKAVQLVLIFYLIVIPNFNPKSKRCSLMG